MKRSPAQIAFAASRRASSARHRAFTEMMESAGTDAFKKKAKVYEARVATARVRFDVYLAALEASFARHHQGQ